MDYTPLDLMGVVVQWSSGLLLLLLFYRLGRFGARRHILRTWVAAWAVQVLSITGFMLQSVVVLAGQPLPSHNVLALLDHLYLPGKLLFTALVALGALHAVRRQLRPAASVIVMTVAVVLGIAADLIDQPILSGSLQIAGTAVVFFGLAIVVARAERASHAPRFPFLAAAMMLFGAITIVYQVGNYFSTSLGRWSVVAGGLGASSGYAEGLVCAILGAAVVVLLIEDAFQAADEARGARLHDLAASGARLTSILEAAREAIVTVDHRGRIELANATAERRFLLLPGGALGRLLTDFVPLDRPLDEMIRDVVATSTDPQRRAIIGTGEGRRSDGSIFPLEFTMGALEAGERSGCVLVIRDLTARRAAEEELQAFERRMAESEKMLAIGRVVSGVAHELNNPLAVVLGQSEHLVDAAADDELRSGLLLINEQAHRARHIVKDLLAFVRQHDDVREPVDLAQLVRRAVASQRGAARAAGVQLNTDLTSQLPPVIGDPVGIEQILVNLIDNAVDAAGRGGRVRITLVDAGPLAELAVEDSGDGVAGNLVDRIFEPFFTTKPPGEGTGLGLAVSLGLAQRNDGTLQLVNRPQAGVGARFVLRLPVDRQVTPIAAPAAARVATLPQPRPRSDGGTSEVMVIDDEAAVRSTLARIFRRGGWAVREAATGEEAVTWLFNVSAAKAPALVLCDVKMPGMSGRDVYAHLQRQRPEFLERLIFVTGDVVDPVTATFLHQQSCQVVEKPFTVAEIARAVEQVIGRTAPSP